MGAQANRRPRNKTNGLEISEKKSKHFEKCNISLTAMVFILSLFHFFFFSLRPFRSQTYIISFGCLFDPGDVCVCLLPLRSNKLKVWPKRKFLHCLDIRLFFTFSVSDVFSPKKRNNPLLCIN